MTRPRVSSALPPAIIDACCLIDVLTSGLGEEILRASAYAWHLPAAVQGEVNYLRQHDPAHPGAVVLIPADLDPLLVSGVLTACAPVDSREHARFAHYATVFRSDGESMCLALAESRGWVVATDDRRAVRVAGQGGLAVISCPQIVKAWADAIRPDPAVLARVLMDIQTLARFRPSPSMIEAAWWTGIVGP